MKLKRFALKGLMILAVAVALCMFFARTVQTITTPKVQLVTASNGRFEEKMTFQAQVYFPSTQEVTIKEAQKLNVKVKRVYVKPGHYVKKGETIFTAEATSYEEDMKKLREDYDAKSKELIQLDIDNRKLSRESRQNELYDAMLEARDALTQAAYDARFTALEAGVTLSGDVSAWPQQLALMGEVPEDVRKAVDKAAAAQSAYQAASDTFYQILENKKLKVGDATFKYINDRNALLKAMDELTEDMVNLSVTMSALAEVRAEQDGYIVSVEISEGDVYDGVKAAYTMSAEGSQPVLRVAVNNTERTIADDTKAEIASETYGTVKSKVEKTVVAADGSKYLHILMPEEWLGEDSSAVRRLVSDGGVQVSITYRAKQSTTLLPPSAVRSEGENADYVYLIENSWGGFMSSSSMKVVKTSVTVLERSDKAVSIAEDLSYRQVADREDRALSDGQTVMEYVQ